MIASMSWIRNWGCSWASGPGKWLCLLFILAVPCQLSAQALTLSIESPAKDAEVVSPELVRGTISDPNVTPIVLIHPMSTDLWWVQRPPAPPNANGEWATLCYLGTETEGEGEYFQIVAIAPAGGLREGMTIRTLPADGARSDVVIVRRRSPMDP